MTEPENVYLENIPLLADLPEKALSDLATRCSWRTFAPGEQVIDLSTLGVNNRVHAELIRLAGSNIQDDSTASISPIPIHGDISSRVSTTRETLARVFSDLTRAGILQRDRDALIILDFEQMNDIVEQVRGEGD